MKKNIESIITLYKIIWINIAQTILFLCLWWCVNGFFVNKWIGVKENFLKLPMAIWQSIPFLILFSMITLIWMGIFIYFFSQTRKLNGITHRPYIFAYMRFLPIMECYYSLVLIIYIVFHFRELRKTMVALIVYAFLVLSLTLFTISNIRKNTPIFLQDAALGKIHVTTYLSTMDFPTKTSKFQLQHAFKSKFFELEDPIQSFISYEYIKKAGDGFICSYWLFANEAIKYSQSNKNFLLIIGKNFAQLSPKQIRTILQIIDEQLNENKQVLALRQSSFSFSDNLKEMEKSVFYSMDNTLLSELRERHIQIVFDDADDAMLLRDYLSNTAINPSNYAIIKLLKEQLHTLSQITNKSEDKYLFINYVVSGLQANADMTDNFYTAMRMVEYIFHYRALCELTDNPEKQMNLPDSLISTMGFWMTIQNSGGKKYDGKVADAYKNIYYILKMKSYTKTKVNYAEICSLLTELRNRYIGHGTMAFSVSEKLFSWVLELIIVVVQIFEQDKRVLSTDSVLFDKIPAFFGSIEQFEMKSGLLFTYKGKEDHNTEYLDYIHGTIFAKETLVYQLDYMGEF